MHRNRSMGGRSPRITLPTVLKRNKLPVPRGVAARQTHAQLIERVLETVFRDEILPGHLVAGPSPKTADDLQTILPMLG